VGAGGGEERDMKGKMEKERVETGEEARGVAD